MKRRIINIDEEKCTGCGLCADACHEGAIAIVDGKAKLMRDDYCDGMGDCLPSCPTGAITFTEKDTLAYDEKAVEENRKKKATAQGERHFSGCPGSQMRNLRKTETESKEEEESSPLSRKSRLGQWPCQIKLVPVNAPYFNGAKLLIAADCTAYAYASIHEDFMKGKITIIGCPKLDSVDYSEKLEAIITGNDIKSVTVLRMEVPCCGGLENAAINAIKRSGKFLPWRVVTFSLDGKILED